MGDDASADASAGVAAIAKVRDQSRIVDRVAAESGRRNVGQATGLLDYFD